GAAAAADPAAVRQTCRRSSSLPPAVTEFADAAAEAEGIAQLLRRRRGAAARSTWAVLARTHAQLKRLAETLDGHGIPCRLSGARTLLQRPEVVALRAELAGAGEGFVRAVHDLALDALDAREAAAGDDT
ncbi:MAG TPA: hypothetical protein DEP69_06535, partial [Acidimicrobiaceae bacterium]|nr:hypothetical protein [Acidimicrobiaceae bacterium]